MSLNNTVDLRLLSNIAQGAVCTIPNFFASRKFHAVKLDD